MRGVKMTKNIEFNQVEISWDGTHHIYENKPLYNNRFFSVMSYHSPGVAAVRDSTGAYHIDLEGRELYQKRFLESFGYYQGLATVRDDSGWYHVDLKGQEVYKKRYGWVGNFQENR